MSEANTATVETAAPATPVVETATTSLTGAATAAATAEAGASSEAGEGEAAAAAGQGAGSEQAAEGGASAEADPPEGSEGEATQSAPEQYADFTLPEGFTLEGDMLDGLTGIAKAHNMTQDQAQALVDLGVKQAQAVQAAYGELAAQSPVILPEHWAKEWHKQTTEDAEIGGAKLPESLALGQRVFATFGSPELAKFLNDTGLNHHPELHRFMVKVGKAVSEDTLVLPQGGQATPEKGGDVISRTASKLYPGMN